MGKYYLAYGSNLNTRQMQYRCPTAKIMGTAEIQDYELLFKGSHTGSYLTIEPKKGSIVPVAVWEVQPGDEVKLDNYEGCPQFYYKKNVKIRYKGILTGRTRTVNAFVYIMHEDRKLGTPSGFYFRTCLEGYDSFGFNYDYLFEAYQKSKA